MQATVATTITISAKPNEVFTYLENLKYHYLWNPQVRTISTIEKLRLSAKYKTESTVLGMTIKATNVVTGFKPSEELILENALGSVQYRAKFKLYPLQHKTTVKLSVTLAADSKIYVFTVPVLKQLALRELKTDLQALKIAVENNLQ